MTLDAYEPVVGLEVHCQLLTRSKLFCSCSTRFGDAPNTNTCPICQGHPGVLPVLNRAVVDHALKVGLALGCRIRQQSTFARKSYFYPDLPKGYQITQYDKPLCEEGALTFTVRDVDPTYQRTVTVKRIHIEEDAGKTVHVEGEPSWLLDFNRAGVPLLEIVSEPQIHSPEEASAYLKELRTMVVALGVCDGNMQEGSFRCDANVSVRKKGEQTLGTRVELKNINSFRYVAQGIAHEVRRQVAVLERGEEVVQETRSYDPHHGITHTLRGKEDAHDYRYFPEPDLPPLVVEEGWVARIRAELPELPRVRVSRLVRDLGLREADAALLVEDEGGAAAFEQAVAAYPGNPQGIANVLVNEVHHTQVTPLAVAAVVRMVDEGRISGKIAKDVLALLVAGRQGDPEALVKEKGWEVVRDLGALSGAVERVLAAHASEAERYRQGKTQILGFLVGKVMRETGGKADPRQVQELLKTALGGHLVP
jgi:aspartyl-tRNA(Asn)/glutamyl-tRNA(Gln) amidotransferase subunit B